MYVACRKRQLPLENFYLQIGIHQDLVRYLPTTNKPLYTGELTMTKKTLLGMSLSKLSSNELLKQCNQLELSCALEGPLVFGT